MSSAMEFHWTPLKTTLPRHLSGCQATDFRQPGPRLTTERRASSLAEGSPGPPLGREPQAELAHATGDRRPSWPMKCIP